MPRTGLRVRQRQISTMTSGQSRCTTADVARGCCGGAIVRAGGAMRNADALERTPPSVSIAPATRPSRCLLVEALRSPPGTK